MNTLIKRVVWKNLGKTMDNLCEDCMYTEDHGGTMGKLCEDPGRTVGEPCEDH